MQPSHCRTLESSPIAPLLLAAALVGLATDARAATPLPNQESAPQEPSAWLAGLAKLVSDERFAELELLGKTEGIAAVVAQLAKDKEALEQAADAEIERRGLTANSTQNLSIQAELGAAHARLLALEAAIRTALTQSAADAHQTSQAADSDRAEIRRIVEDALIRDDTGLLYQFGGAIEDQLAEHALAATHPAALLRTKTRVLATLAAVAPERAVDVALELSGRPGRGWAAAIGQSLHKPMYQGVPSTVHVPAGPPGSKPFELALWLLGSDEVPVDTRVTLALQFLAAGHDDSRLLAASEALAPEMRRYSAFQSSKLEWWHDQLLASESPEVRRAAAFARLDYADADDLALLERLLQDADPEMRATVASRLHELVPQKAPVSVEYRALWTRALADPSTRVRGMASERLVRRANSGTFPLSAKATMELLLLLDDPAEAAARADLLAEVKPVIGALPTVATSNEELGQVYAALLESRLAEVTNGVFQALINTHHEVSIAVLSSLGAPSPDVLESLASNVRGYQKLRQASAEGCLRAFAHVLQRPQQSAALVEVLREALREKSRQQSLDSLPTADAVEVLLRSAEAASELVEGFLLKSRWDRCTQALTAAAADATRSHTERSLALIALERSRPSTPQSATALAESIAAAFRDESERDSALSLVIWATGALDTEPKAHGALLIALLGRAEVPTAAFDHVGWTDAHAEALSAEERRVLFDALEQRAVAAGRSGSMPFEPFALAALAVMQQDPSLVRAALVTRWSEWRLFIAAATAAALRAPDAELRASVRNRILAQLEQVENGQDMTSYVAALIHLEGPDAAADIAERAATLGKPKLVTIATELLESSAKLREVGARLATSSTGASREAAINEVVTLLDDPDEAVRVEAIRGLATLGAIEHLPRLIRIVGKGTPAERTAARAALDTLHQRAAREPQQAAPLQAPPAQSGNEARDGEAPR